MTSADILAGLLEGAKTGNRKNQYLVKCPCKNHQDKEKDLSIIVSTSGEGVLIRCQGGCSYDEIISALGISMEEAERDCIFPESPDDEAKENRQNVFDLLITKLNPKTGENVPVNIAENFLTVLRNDKTFDNVRFNVMHEYPEKLLKNGQTVPWTDADDSAARTYIELHYGLSSPLKYADAFAIFEQEHRYHPVQYMLDKLSWDGQKRCERFLIDCLGCKDTPYVRECSRLIFAGGVNRAYEPGCKFDCVIVLIGNQGGGKTTAVRWLAIRPDFYSSAKTISGQKGIEALDGIWICELEELLAVLANEKGGTKVEESAKAFLTAQSDYYRRPWAHRSTHSPRNNIFIGTTNRSEFLTDKTGNRRWYPVRCNQTGDYLFCHEAEIHEYIRQAWAEMVAAYKARDPFASPTENRKLLQYIRDEQKGAEVDDWRIGMIEAYIAGKKKVCCKELWDNALFPDRYAPPYNSNTSGREIAEILVNQLGWIRTGKSDDFGKKYGKQKSFVCPPEEKEERDKITGYQIADPDDIPY